MATVDQSSEDSKMTTEDSSAAASGGAASANPAEPKNVQELTNYIQNMLQQMQDRFQTMSDQIISRIDDMGSRIDDLEHNINDLMAQSGQAEQGAIQDQSSKQWSKSELYIFVCWSRQNNFLYANSTCPRHLRCWKYKTSLNR